MRCDLGLLLAAIAVVGCSDHERAAPTTGVAVRYMHITESPEGRPLPDQRLAVKVEVHRLGQHPVLKVITVDGTGRFRIVLPAGRYELVARPGNRNFGAFSSHAFTEATTYTIANPVGLRTLTLSTSLSSPVSSRAGLMILVSVSFQSLAIDQPRSSLVIERMFV